MGSDGSVITEGRRENAPGDGDLVDVPVSAVVAGVVGGIVVVAVTAAGAGPPWASRTMP